MKIEELINNGSNENKTGVHDYKAHKIILIDLNGVQPEGIKSRAELAKTIIFASPLNSVLLLTDFRNMRYDHERAEYAKQVSKDIKPFVKKSALLGVEGLKKIIVRSMLVFSGRTNMQPFSEVKEALEWLII